MMRDLLQTVIPAADWEVDSSLWDAAGSPPGDKESAAMVLDIGCGYVKRPGSIGLDLIATPDVDVVADFTCGLPFKDNSVDGIYTAHTLEHTDNLLAVMEEFWRVCKQNAPIYVAGPHASCSYGTWSDPTHRRGLTLETFRYFDEHHYYNFYTRARFKIAWARLCFTLASRRARQRWPRRLATRLLEGVANANAKSQHRCERWWGPLVGIEEVHVLLQVIK